MDGHIAQVAVPVPRGDTYDYVIPDSYTVAPGSRVLVPFGTRRLIGIVIAVAQTSTVPCEKQKALLATYDDTPYFSASHIAWLQSIARYYHTPLGSLIETALPSYFRKKTAPVRLTNNAWRCTQPLDTLCAAVHTRAQKQRAVLAAFAAADTDVLSDTDIRAAVPNASAALTALEKKALLTRTTLPLPAHNRETQTVRLHDSQQRVVDWVSTHSDRYAPLYVEGKTGSGKTEVYIAAARAQLARGKQVLVLLPEIGLTPQMADRFSQALGIPVPVQHSAVSAQMRAEQALQAARGTLSIMLGTRSSIFIAFRNLGLIIIDEEHDASYKQHEGLPYHARSVAVMRAKHAHIPIVFGSATPAFESYAAIERGHMTHMVIQRPVEQHMPTTVRVIDMRPLPKSQLFSTQLLDAMERHLREKGQVLLFLNRRGYAPIARCQYCAHVQCCPECALALVYHRTAASLQCHGCGFSCPVDTLCTRCGGNDIRLLGFGTERAASEIATYFPSTPILRIDRDVMNKKDAFAHFVETMHIKAPYIVIGTQMLAKGHNFPHLTLAGILDSDYAMRRVALRAEERFAQLFVQVAGRVGRADRAGEVVVQTRYPDHPVLDRVRTHGYSAFAQHALTERRHMQLPPFCFQGAIKASDRSEARLQSVLQTIRTAIAEKTDAYHITWHAPEPLPLSKLHGRYRYCLLFSSTDRQQLHSCAALLQPYIRQYHNTGRTRLLLDIDAYDFD